MFTTDGYSNMHKFFKYNKLNRWLFLIAWFGCGIITLVIISNSSNYVALQSKQISLKTPGRFSKNHMGPTSYVHNKSEIEDEFLYSIKFDRLDIKNGNLGIFKTGLYKIAKVKGLQVKLFDQTDDITNNKMTNSPDSAATFDNTPLTKNPYQIFKEFVSIIQGGTYSIGTPGNPELGGATEIKVKGVDLSGVAEIIIKDFNYQLFSNQNKMLTIECKRVIGSYESPNITLRGYVKLTTADGSILESNHIKWDINKQQFNVVSPYVLNRNGEISFGADICVDSELNVIKKVDT